MRFTGLDFILWLAGLTGHTILLCVLLVRRLTRKLPVFTSLIAANIAQTTTLYTVLMEGSKATYYYTYWAFSILEAILELCVFYEVASKVFRPAGVWARDIRFRVACCGLAALALAMVLAWLASPPSDSWIKGLVIKGHLFNAVLLSMLFATILVTSARVGLAWRNHIWQVALGLGIYSMSTIIIEGLHNYLGLTGGDVVYKTLSQARILIYLAVLCYWVVMLSRAEQQARSVPVGAIAQLLTLSNQASSDLEKLRRAGDRH